MFKNMKKQLNNEKGLTLIELLAVIVILAIIAAIAVPAIGNIINNSHDKALLADASNILSGAKIAMVDGSCSSETVCLGTELNSYIEGLEAPLTADDKATKHASGDWSITYSKLVKANFKGSKYTSLTITDKTLSESELNTALGR
jgi:type IV pilus assembly protein PilA